MNRQFSNGVSWQVIPAEKNHIPAIAADMREADAREVWASHRHTPLEALEYSLARSELAWTCTIYGQPAFMWGVARQGSLLSEKGAPWLLGTNLFFMTPGRTSCATRALGLVASPESVVSGSQPAPSTAAVLAALHREFLRRCRGYVDLMQERFPRLENFVHAENRRSIRWLKWCGFTVSAPAGAFMFAEASSANAPLSLQGATAPASDGIVSAPVRINGEKFFRFWRDDRRDGGCGGRHLNRREQ